jgi:3-oxoadipate CoA-transferase alpha subunit
VVAKPWNEKGGVVINKALSTCSEAVSAIFDGATVMIGGFGEPGVPGRLIEALREQGTTDLTVIHNGAGFHDFALGGLIKDGRVRKLVASFPNYPSASAFRDRYLKGDIELELVPQGTLIERIRAAGAGLGGFYTRTGVGTELAAGKETRVIDGRQFVFELPLHADFALLKAERADRIGNLTYRYAMRNFNPVMATAANTVIAEVDKLVPVGTLAPDEIHTPGIFIDHIVEIERHPRLFEPEYEEAET